jgi:hypothetical protein
MPLSSQSIAMEIQSNPELEMEQILEQNQDPQQIWLKIPPRNHLQVSALLGKHLNLLAVLQLLIIK